MNPETMENVRRHLAMGSWECHMLNCGGMNQYLATSPFAAVHVASLCDRHERAVRLLEKAAELLHNTDSLNMAASDEIKAFLAEQEPNNV